MRRLVALLCLGSGALLNAATGPCEGKGSDEQSLLRSMLDTLQDDDILLGDAYFPTFFLVSQPLERGAGSEKYQDNARHGEAALQDPGDGHQRAVGLSAGL
jgi:hypothetical protein